MKAHPSWSYYIMLKQFNEKYADTPLGRLEMKKPLSAYSFPQLELTLGYRGCITCSESCVSYISVVLYDTEETKTHTLNMFIPVIYLGDILPNFGHISWPMTRFMCYPDYADMMFPAWHEDKDVRDIMFDCVCRNVFAKNNCPDRIKNKLRLLSDTIGNSNVACMVGSDYYGYNSIGCHRLVRTALVTPFIIRRIIFTRGHSYYFRHTLSDTKYATDKYIQPDNFY